MSEFQLKMTLDCLDASDAQVRVWIDTELGGDLSCEQEIDLVRDDEESSWSGLFSAEGEAFIYRVGIRATPGTAWSLSVRDASSDGEELLYDSDLLTMAKEWLIGSCDPSCSNDAEGGWS